MSIFYLLLSSLLVSQVLALQENELPSTNTLYLALKRPEGVVEKMALVATQVSDPASPVYGQYLTHTEINDLTKSDVQTWVNVIRWLETLPYEEQQTKVYYPDSLRVTLGIDSIEREFGVKMDKIAPSGYRYTLDPYTLPIYLQKSVDFVEGFGVPLSINNRRLQMHSTPHFVDQSVDPGMIGKEVISRLYNLPKNQSLSSKVSVGLMEFGGEQAGFVPSDLNNAQVGNGLASDAFAQNHILGDVGGPDLESQLDVQFASIMAPGVTLWYDDWQGWLYGQAVDYLDRTDRASIISFSYGWSSSDQCEFANCGNMTSEEYVERVNYEYSKLAAAGVTMVVSSGDAGSPGRTNEGCLGAKLNVMNPVMPGGSQWVTSVGATYLVAGDKQFNYTTPVCQSNFCANGILEKGITFNATSWTSGSGFDLWTPTPKWQKKQVEEYLNSGVYLPQNYFNDQGRGYPDVSAIGHNCLIQDGGGWIPLDGTSCSAPVFAGVLANLNDYQLSKNRSRVGFANPLLYKMSEICPNAFNDIFSGNTSCTESMCCGKDSGFTAIAGWDAATGLGTPNVGEMKKCLDLLFD